MVFSTIFLCGAVPFEAPPDSQSTTLSSPIHIVCCRCHAVPSAPPPPPPRVVLLPDVVVDSLPRRNKITDSSFPIDNNTKSRLVEQCSDQEDQVDDDSSRQDIGKTLDQWRQVGRELRLIADTFSTRGSSSNQPPPINGPNWIWNALLQGAVVYVGWRIHRWTGGS